MTQDTKWTPRDVIWIDWGFNPPFVEVSQLGKKDNNDTEYLLATSQRKAAPELYEALKRIKWKSADKDNMEFSTIITCYQMDAIRTALAKAHGETE